MSNLKKILALVLALVMSFSLVSVSSAAFEDVDDVNATYSEAVEVLTGLGVFNGRTETEFAPKANITRAEVAAIIYRVATGDVKGTQVGIYADYNKFDDVKSDAWYAGYVNYCANAEYIKGYDAKTFGPNDQVTGYQALAMILRAVGYDKAGEFTGSGWQVQTAKYGKTLGITKNLTEATLGTAASREVVAEILFQTIAYVPQVTYTLLGGYDDDGSILSNQTLKNPTIGYATFKLAYDKTVSHDSWGRPYHVWYKDTVDGAKDAHKTTEWNGSSYESVVAYVNYVPTYSSTVAETECDIVAKTFGSTYSVDRLTINAQTASAAQLATYFNGNDDIEALATKLTIGAQGRLTEIYYTDDGDVEVVMIDEYLARVTGVTDLVYDANGHVKYAATLTLAVYDADTNNVKAGFKTVTLSSTKSNYTYAIGDMLLVNAKAVAFNSAAVANTTATQLIKFVGYAESFEGKQTAFSNRDSHIIDTVETPDNLNYHLDEAQASTANHTWYMDSYGNLIGSVEVAAETKYGVISAIKWHDSDVNLASGYAWAKVTFVDGTDAEMKIYAVNGKALKDSENSANVKFDLVNGVFAVSENVQHNKAAWTNNALYRITPYLDGYVLTATTQLHGSAQVLNNVTMVSTNQAYANTNTKFLVWNGLTYETYTGIQNVPSYYPTASLNADDEWFNMSWAANITADVHAEYIFLPNAVRLDNVKTEVFFVEDGDALYVYSHVVNSVVKEYTVVGGMVNGEPTTLKVKAGDERVLAALNALMTSNKAVLIDFTGEYVTDVTTFNNKTLVSTGRYVDYLGAATSTSYSYGTLVAADGESYDITTAKWYGVPNLDAASSLELAKRGKMNLYIDYTVTAGRTEKVATAIYATVDLFSAPAADPVQALIDAVNAALAEVDAAQKAVDSAKAKYYEATGTVLAALTQTEKDALLVAARAELVAAEEALTKALAKLEAAVTALAGNTTAAAELAKNNAAAVKVQAAQVQATLTKTLTEVNKVAPATAADKADLLADLKKELVASIQNTFKGTDYKVAEGDGKVYVYEAKADTLLTENTIKVYNVAVDATTGVELTLSGTVSVWTAKVNALTGTYAKVEAEVEALKAEISEIARNFLAGFAK